MIVARRAFQVRSFMTSALRRGGDHHDVGGVPGANLPFGIQNRWKLAVYMGAWLGSGFAVPFILVRHQLKKK
ncbi:unnamed protein product [Orchesella dallaii]|uniref:Cytochrome c oxidase polypeptide VIIc n=1 Tax=Orchesella dallaii TaxID=48710 RepID=A0ABP1PZ70_9HEXA